MTERELKDKKKIWKGVRLVFTSALLIMTTLFYTGCSNDDDDKAVYTVIFEADGGSPVPATQRVEEGKTATAPAINPAKAGYVFSYWYLSGSTTAYNFQTSVTGNITLYAKWQEEATAEYWQIAWNLNGGSWPSGDNHATQVIKGGTLAEPNAPIKTGSTFEGWYKESALTNKIDFPYDVSGIATNITLYAKWTTEDGDDNHGDVTIYTAGYYVNPNNVKVPCYWKNSTRYDLTDGNLGAEVHDITVVGDVVYMAGYYRAGDGTVLVPCYWINDQKYDLCTSPAYGEAIAIEVYDGKIYTAGYCNTSKNDKNACYWVDQERHDIYSMTTTYSTRNAVARDIMIIDGTVYTCGYYNFGSDKIACYWIGSTKHDMQSTNYNSYAYSMCYTGSEFYIAGSYGNGIPCYYEAGFDGYKRLCNTLKTNQTGGYGYANDICISGNDIYAVGYKGALGSTNNALFWKNNNVEQIIASNYTPGTAKDFTAESICLSDDIVYIAGNNHNGAACYWTRDINGNSFIETILAEEGKASAIVAK